MKIINNLSSKNHFERIGDLFKESHETIVASPFLMSDFTSFLDKFSAKPNSKIEIITTLQPNSIEQIRKVDSLLSFFRHPSIQKNNVEVSVSINNKLHGKIYLFNKNNVQTAIISSANFTQNGLLNNHEWGIEISEVSQIEVIKNDLLQSIEKEGISIIDLENMKVACNRFRDMNEIPKQKQKIKLRLLSLIPTDTSFTEFPEATKFWIKPLGVTGGHIEEGEKYESLELKIHFSKKPKINVGDVLICYGVGVKKILSIYRVEELPKNINNEEPGEEPWKKRWAWYVIGKNISPNYGGKWWEHNLNAFNLVEDFKQNNPNISITNVGGNSLGGLKFGSDKLHLKREFAEYIIDRIIAINRKTLKTV